MSRYLITHSLLSSWLHLMRGNPYEDATTERDPFPEFMKVLRREPTETTEAMQNGIDFENLVTNIIDFGPQAAKGEKWEECALKVAEHCKGGILQYRAKKPISVAGMDFMLYGRLDCLKAGEIIDIKFTKSYDAGKFYDSTQHPVYMELIPEANRFTYLASNGSNVFRESYRRDETADIKPYIEEFALWLSAQGLLELYKEKWSAL